METWYQEGEEEEEKTGKDGRLPPAPGADWSFETGKLESWESSALKTTGRSCAAGSLETGLSANTEIVCFPSSALKILCSHSGKERGLTRAMSLGVDTDLG